MSAHGVRGAPSLIDDDVIFAGELISCPSSNDSHRVDLAADALGN